MKQWAVKLTLDYGLADRAHKGNQTLVNGKEVLSYPPGLHPHDPFPVQDGVGGFEGEAVVGGIWEVQGSVSLFPAPEAGLPKELEAAPGREAFAGRMVSSDSCETPVRQHRAHGPSGDTSPPHPCLPSQHCHAGWIFLLEHVFCYDELWVKVKLLTPRWGFRHQERLVCPSSKMKCHDVPDGRQCGGAGQCQPRGCCVWASRALQKRHSSLLCASHQHSQSSVSRTPLISTTATEENK